MLGRLAKWLRLMGFSVEYAKPDVSDESIMDHCREESLFLLTRDRELAARYGRSMYMESDDFKEQIRNFLKEFRPDSALYFTRCPLCNSVLDRVPVTELGDKVPPGVRQRFEHVYHCPGCGKIYWEGSHFDSIGRTIRELTGEV